MGEMGSDEKLMEKCWRPEDTKQTKITQYMKKRKKTWSLEAAKDTLHTWLPSEERQLHSPPRKKRLVEKEYCDILTKTTVLLSQPEDLTEDLKRMTLWQDCMKSLTERFQAAKQSEITRYLQPSASTTKTPTVQVKEEITVQSKPSAWETMISTVQMEEDTTDQVPNEKENQREIHRKKDRKKRPSMKMSDMENLHKLSMSVCQVHFCGRPCGTGFLLFGGFILTNAHVVRNIQDSETGRLLPSVTVTFENLGIKISEVPVELNLIVYRHGSSHHVLDYALLQLMESQTIKLPPGLLSMCGQLPQRGEIYIIGYPGGGEKEVSLAVIIEFQKRAIAFGEYFKKTPGHIGAIIGALLKEKWSFEEMEDPHLMTYDTSFLHGSSGSPVFLSNGRLVSMHTGGYSYEVDGETYSIIEYAIPIMPVLEDIMWQLLNSKDIPMQQKLEYWRSFIGEAWKGLTDIMRMIAFCLTEVLMRLGENQVYPLALRVLLGAVEGTEKHVKTRFRKALREAMDMKPSLKGISKQGLVDLAKTQEEQSSLHALGQFLFPEKQRGALTDITVNTQGAKKQRKRGKGKNKGGGRRGEGTLCKGLYRI